MNPTTEATRRLGPTRPVQPAVLPPTEASGSLSPAATQFGFGLFLVVNGMLFIRPTEYLSDVVGQRAFLAIILACFFLAFPAVLAQFDGRKLSTRPLLTLALLWWPCIVLSDLVRGRIDHAVEGFIDYARILIYYLLLLGLVTTPQRLRSMLYWLTWFAVVLVVIAILQYNGIIQLELFKQLKDGDVLRLKATGLFADPNDLGVLIVIALVCSVYFCFTPRAGLHSLLWLGVIGLFLYGLKLTHSRGAILALGGAGFVLLRARIGTFSAGALAVLAMPVLLLFTGREVDLSSRYDTSYTRFELWSDALYMYGGSPLFGVGYQELHNQIGQVAHNSYLHAFAELGFFGGSIFLGMFVWALWTLIALPMNRRQITDPDLLALHPTITAILVAYMIGMCSLTLNYIMPTFTILGLAAVYLHMTPTRPALPATRMNDRFYLWLAFLGVLFWLGIRVVIRIVPRG